jgi:hypothetical protein
MTLDEILRSFVTDWEDMTYRFGPHLQDDPQEELDLASLHDSQTKQAKAAIKHLFLELSGEDYPDASFGSENWGKEQLRAELRQKVEEL